jgi:Zn-finger nucleic acid-binding protein
VCGTCQGTFCDRDTLKRLITDALQTPALQGYDRPALSLAGTTRYIRCPVCAELMNRRNFSSSSGVVIDTCAQDGVWFDDGELAQILLFCGSGELTKSQRFDQERRRAQRELQSFQDQLDSAGPRHYFAPMGGALDIAIIAGVLNELDHTFASPIGSPRPEVTSAPEPIRKMTHQERLAHRRSKALHQQAEQVVQRVYLVGGVVMGALLGVLFAPQFQIGRGARHLGIDPFSIRPALVVIAAFAVLGGVIGWRVGRHSEGGPSKDG